jgi:hypothetical protein
MNRFETDKEIISFLENCNASKEYIVFVLRFPDCPSVQTWKNHWKNGMKDFGGHFGTALFEGDMQGAVAHADTENSLSLKLMGYTRKSVGL